MEEGQAFDVQLRGCDICHDREAPAEMVRLCLETVTATGHRIPESIVRQGCKHCAPMLRGKKARPR